MQGEKVSVSCESNGSWYPRHPCTALTTTPSKFGTTGINVIHRGVALWALWS